MMKLTFLAVVALLAVSFAGCSKNEGMNEFSLVEYDIILKEDTNVQELLAIRDEMIARVIENGASGIEMSEIVKTNDLKRFALILGYTEEELSDLGTRIAFLGGEIQNTYPDLITLAESQIEKCPGCDFETIAQKWDQTLMKHNEADVFYGDGENGIPLPDPSQKGVSCQWVPYTASLALCTATGPVLYWACAVVAVCSFCAGGWVTTVCG